MATIHCPECEDGDPCPHHHLYVIQLRDEIGKLYSRKSGKGYLYVGSTTVSVEKRGKSNFTRIDGSYVDPDVLYEDRKLPVEQQKWPEDGKWKYNTRSIPKIRSYFLEYRTDLVLYDNPIPYEKNDPGKTERFEGRLADKLRNRGWIVINRVSRRRDRESN